MLHLLTGRRTDFEVTPSDRRSPSKITFRKAGFGQMCVKAPPTNRPVNQTNHPSTFSALLRGRRHRLAIDGDVPEFALLFVALGSCHCRTDRRGHRIRTDVVVSLGGSLIYFAPGRATGLLGLIVLTSAIWSSATVLGGFYNTVSDPPSPMALIKPAANLALVDGAWR